MKNHLNKKKYGKQAYHEVLMELLFWRVWLIYMTAWRRGFISFTLNHFGERKKYSQW